MRSGPQKEMHGYGAEHEGGAHEGWRKIAHPQVDKNQRQGQEDSQFLTRQAEQKTRPKPADRPGRAVAKAGHQGEVQAGKGQAVGESRPANAIHEVGLQEQPVPEEQGPDGCSALIGRREGAHLLQ